MKLSVIGKAIQPIIQPYIDKMQYVLTFNCKEKRTRGTPYPEEMSLCGIYLFYVAGADPKKDRPVYIGETIATFKKRSSNHKRSLRDPDWPHELTGKKFIKYKINRFKDFDLYIIPYDEKVGQYDSRTLEGMIKLALNPMVFE